MLCLMKHPPTQNNDVAGNNDIISRSLIQCSGEQGLGSKVTLRKA